MTVTLYKTSLILFKDIKEDENIFFINIDLRREFSSLTYDFSKIKVELIFKNGEHQILDYEQKNVSIKGEGLEVEILSSLQDVKKVLIYRDTPPLQNTNFAEVTNFSIATESAIDLITLILQELKDKTDFLNLMINSKWEEMFEMISEYALFKTQNLGDIPDKYKAKQNLNLENVDNTADKNKPISKATQNALDLKANSNDVYLKTETYNKTEIEGKLNLKENTIAIGKASEYFRGDKTWATLDKTAVGLNNIDNTSDLNKPISTKVQKALDDKIDKIADASPDEIIIAGEPGKLYSSKRKISTDETLTSANDIPTVSAVKAYADKIALEAGSVSSIVFQNGEQTTEEAGAVLINKEKLGLDKVENIAPTDMPISKAVESAILEVLSKISNLDNTADLEKPISELVQEALNGKENNILKGTNTQYFRGDKTWQTLNKQDVGLANVDNTNDLAKPISNAVQNALNSKVDTSGINDLINNIITTRISTDITLGGASARDDLTPSQKAAKLYVDNEIKKALGQVKYSIEGPQDESAEIPVENLRQVVRDVPKQKNAVKSKQVKVKAKQKPKAKKKK